MNMLKAIQAGAEAAVAADPHPLAVKTEAAFVNPAPRKATSALRQVSAAKSAPVYKLVDEKTGAEISLPARMKCWDGYEITIKAFQPSRYQSSGGYISTDLGEVFVASVVDAKVVEISQ